MAHGIEPELLRELIHYEPATGKLIWLERAEEHFCSKRACSVWNARYALNEAFTYTLRGYKYGRIFDRHFAAHRVAWAIQFGYWPRFIDHVNGDRSDNRIVNLRDVSQAENNRNTKMKRTNKSGVTGVWLDPRNGNWSAYIGVNGGRRVLGQFARKDDAVRARKVAEREHGYHPNHGRVA